MSVCALCARVLIICTLRAPSLIVSLTCAHLCLREERRRRAAGAWERWRFGRSLRGSRRLWSSFFFFLSEICVSMCVRQRQNKREAALPWQYIRCLAGAGWPAALSPLHHSGFPILSPPPTNKGKEVSFSWCQAEQRHRMKHSFVVALPFVHTASKTHFSAYFSVIHATIVLRPCWFLFPKFWKHVQHFITAKPNWFLTMYTVIFALCPTYRGTHTTLLKDQSLIFSSSPAWAIISLIIQNPSSAQCRPSN